jgi:hypothetical protein
MLLEAQEIPLLNLDASVILRRSQLPDFRNAPASPFAEDYIARLSVLLFYYYFSSFTAL